MTIDYEIWAAQRKMYIFLALEAIPIIILFFYANAIMKRTSPYVFVFMAAAISYVFVYRFIMPAAREVEKLKKKKAEEEKFRR